MPKTIDPGQFAAAGRNAKTEILFETPGAAENHREGLKKDPKNVQIAFYLTAEDAARLNVIHARLLADSGAAGSRANRVRDLVLEFIEEHRHLLNDKTIKS